MSDDSITIDELMQECGVAYRTARRRLRAAGVMPSHQDKRGRRYPRAEAFAAIDAGEDQDGGAQGSARERFDLARARREELVLAKEMGEVLYVTEAMNLLGALVTEARNRLLAIPSMEDTPAAFRPVLDQRIREALQTLADWKPPLKALCADPRRE